MADTRLTTSIGEHWVCSMLARHDWAAALTRDGLERTDILAVGTTLEDRPLVEIQVKTATGASEKTSWALNRKAQQMAQSPREWFVFVACRHCRVGRVGFVVPATAWRPRCGWCTRTGSLTRAARPGARDAALDRARVRMNVWAGYEDRWDLLATPTDEVPVLLPGWVRERALEARVGFPAGHPWCDDLPGWAAQ